MPLALRSQSATRQFEVEAQRSVAISAPGPPILWGRAPLIAMDRI